MRKGAGYVLVALFVVGVLAIGVSAADGNSCNIFCKIANWFAGKSGITGAVTFSSSDSSPNNNYEILAKVSLASERQKATQPKMPTQTSQTAKNPNRAPQEKLNPLNSQNKNSARTSPISDVTIRLFDASSDEFKAKWKPGKMPQYLMADVYEARDGMLVETITDFSGTAAFEASSPGKYLLIAKYIWTDANGATQTTYLSKQLTPVMFKDKIVIVGLTANKIPIKTSPVLSRAKARWLQ